MVAAVRHRLKCPVMPAAALKDQAAPDDMLAFSLWLLGLSRCEPLVSGERSTAMLPTTQRPFLAPFENLHREIDRAFGRAVDWTRENQGAGWYPVNIRETDDHLYIEAEMPGFTRDQINVTLEKNVLTIQAQRETQQEEGEQHLMERRINRVSRAFRLPTEVDENKVEAKLENGVLMLTLYKRDEVKARRIEVQ